MRILTFGQRERERKQGACTGINIHTYDSYLWHISLVDIIVLFFVFPFKSTGFCKIHELNNDRRVKLLFFIRFILPSAHTLIASSFLNICWTLKLLCVSWHTACEHHHHHHSAILLALLELLKMHSHIFAHSLLLSFETFKQLCVDI